MDTRNVVDPNIIKYKGFPSIHDKLIWDRYELKNNGYDYTEHFLENFTTKYFQQNPMMYTVFPFLNKILVSMVQRVKFIQTYFNYAIDKNYDRLNY